MQQAFDFGSDVVFVQTAKPPPDDCPIGINQHILRLRGNAQLPSYVIQGPVINVQHDPFDATRECCL